MSTQRSGQPVPARDQGVWQSWIAFVGPTALYVVYFSLVYLLGEAGCTLESLRITLWGAPLVTTVSLLLGGIALLGVLVLARLARRVTLLEGDVHRFMGRAGLLSSGFSAFLLIATEVFVLVVPPC